MALPEKLKINIDECLQRDLVSNVNSLASISTLGERIRSERNARKMSQEELGNLVGVGKSSVCQWERGLTKNMDGINLVKTALALGLNPIWLALEKGSKPIYSSDPDQENVIAAMQGINNTVAEDLVILSEQGIKQIHGRRLGYSSDAKDINFELIHENSLEMPGVNRSHNIITINMLGMLHAYLRNTSSRVYSSEMKVRVKTDSDDCFFYPDLHVTYSDTDNAEFYNTQPKLIIEVLSDATERYDRAEKFHHYRKLTSLEEYVLIAQDLPRVECYRRAQFWDLQLYQHDDVWLESIGLKLPLADIYEGVVFADQATG